MTTFERFDEYMSSHMDEDASMTTPVERDDREPSSTMYKSRYTFDDVIDDYGVSFEVNIVQGERNLEERQQELEDRRNNNDLIDRAYKDGTIDLTDEDGTLYEVMVEQEAPPGFEGTYEGPVQLHIMLYQTEDGDRYIVHNDIAINDEDEQQEWKYEIDGDRIGGLAAKGDNRAPFRDDANYSLEDGLQQCIRNITTVTAERLQRDHDDDRDFLEEMRLYALRQSVEDFIASDRYTEMLRPPSEQG